MEQSGRGWRLDLGLILILLLVGTGIKAWLLTHTEVLAKDGIGFIQFAARLQQEPWLKVLREANQHPLYPIHVLVISSVLQGPNAAPDCLAWQRSAQMANALAAVLLAAPMYLLGRHLFGRRVGFTAALLFQVMPVPARITADALTEGTFLLLAAMALLFAAWGFQKRAWGWFAMCGLAGGLAYLTRPEGALLILCTALILVGPLFSRDCKSHWQPTVLCTGSLGLTTLLIVAPYWMIIGRLTPKPTANQILASAEREWNRNQAVAASTVLFAARFTPGVNGVGEEGVSPSYAAAKVLDELLTAFHYVLWLPALAAMLWFRRRLATEPALGLLVLICLIQLLVLCRLAITVGYVSERHTLLIVLCGYILAAAGFAEAARRWTAWSQARQSTNAEVGWRKLLQPQAALATVLLVLLGWGAVRTLRPLHPGKSGHKEAGFWLAQHTHAHDQLVDPYGWASFYAGRVMAHPAPAAASVSAIPRQYVIWEPHETDDTRLHIVEQVGGLEGREPVFTWPAGKRPRLIVYGTPPLENGKP